MGTLLYLKCSPLEQRSYSVAVADAFVKAYRSKNPDDEIVKVNLFEAALPEFGALAAQGKYNIMHGKEHTQAQAEAWGRVKTVIQQFKSADKYALAVPMWNFGLPWRLKQYIDIIVQPSLTFSYSADSGYKGLVTGKKAFVACARGGRYSSEETRAFDYQKPYMETILAFMGVTDVSSVVVEPTLQEGPESADKARTAAIEHARQIAESF